MMPALSLVVIRVADMEVSVRFYQRLGLTFAAHRHGKGAEHYAAEVSNCVFEIYPRRSEQDSTAGVRLGFRVADVDGLADQLKDAGFKIVSEPADSEWGRRAVVEDPDGHRVEFVSEKVERVMLKEEG